MAKVEIMQFTTPRVRLPFHNEALAVVEGDPEMLDNATSDEWLIPEHCDKYAELIREVTHLQPAEEIRGGEAGPIRERLLLVARGGVPTRK